MSMSMSVTPVQLDIITLLICQWCDHEYSMLMAAVFLQYRNVRNKQLRAYTGQFVVPFRPFSVCSLSIRYGVHSLS